MKPSGLPEDHHANLSAIIQIREIRKFFGSFQALHDVSLTVRSGERVVICGPFGSEFFSNPRSERSRLFLQQILQH